MSFGKGWEDRNKGRGGSRHQPPPHRDYRYDRFNRTANIAGHSIIPMIGHVIGIIWFIYIFVQEVSSYDDCLYFYSEVTCRVQHNTGYAVAGIIGEIVLLILMFVAIGMIANHVENMNNKRTLSNWATWGTLLLAIGPIIAITLATSEKMQRRSADQLRRERAYKAEIQAREQRRRERDARQREQEAGRRESYGNEQDGRY